MRACLLLFALAAFASPAAAQDTDAARWTGPNTGVSIILPPGWTPDPAGNAAGNDIIRRPSSAADHEDGAMCTLMQLKGPASGRDGQPLTQKGINRESSPMPVSAWLSIIERVLGVDDLTSVESLATRIIDGKATLSAIAVSDRATRIYIPIANAVTPAGVRAFICVYRTGLEPAADTGGLRETIAAEFDALIGSARIPS